MGKQYFFPRSFSKVVLDVYELFSIPQNGKGQGDCTNFRVTVVISSWFSRGLPLTAGAALLLDDLKMCIKYFAFALLWFPGVLHGENNK